MRIFLPVRLFHTVRLFDRPKYLTICYCTFFNVGCILQFFDIFQLLNMRAVSFWIEKFGLCLNQFENSWNSWKLPVWSGGSEIWASERFLCLLVMCYIAGEYYTLVYSSIQIHTYFLKSKNIFSMFYYVLGSKIIPTLTHAYCLPISILV